MKKSLYLLSLGLASLLLAGCPNNSPTAAAILNASSLSTSTSQAYAGVSGPQVSIPITVNSNTSSSVSQGFSFFAVNNSSGTPALGIQLVPSLIPAGMSVQYQDASENINTSGCASTRPGQTCTILLTGNGSVAPGNYTLQVTSSNSPLLAIPLNVQWPDLAIVTSGITDTTYTLNLTNASQIPIENLSTNITPPSPSTGWTIDQSVDDCGTTLAAGSSCVLATVTDTQAGDPRAATIVATGNNLESAVTLTALSPYCSNNVNNFNTEEVVAPYYIGNNPQIDPQTGIAWGPNVIKPIAINSNILSCATNTEWAQERANASANYWIGQKVNYCHHHAPTWLLPILINGESYRNANNCSTSNNIMPGSANYGQLTRWNYGTNGPSPSTWQTNNMWIGIDCSDYTGFIYNFGMQTILDTDVAFQAGQYYPADPPNPPEWLSELTPNQQTPSNSHVLLNSISPSSPLGLVCNDATTDEHDSLCTNGGGYISVVNTSGVYNSNAITASVLEKLKPGDLLYFGIGPGNSWSPSVIHVMIWTGKKVVANGDTNPNGVQMQYIAPEEHCPDNVWKPQIGDWVITDSHYQGPDYRIFTSCYYGVNLWGVRRIINP